MFSTSGAHVFWVEEYQEEAKPANGAVIVWDSLNHIWHAETLTPSINIEEVKKRRFTVIDRVQKARQEIMAREDARVFAMMDTIATSDPYAAAIIVERSKR